jgi:hypothetical protein
MNWFGKGLAPNRIVNPPGLRCAGSHGSRLGQLRPSLGAPARRLVVSALFGTELPT